MRYAEPLKRKDSQTTLQSAKLDQKTSKGNAMSWIKSLTGKHTWGRSNEEPLPDIVGALTNQTIGGQSLIYRLFRESLGCEDSSIWVLELTYFAASVTSYVYLRFGKERNRDQILDRFAKSILEKSIPASREPITFGAAVSQYQKRYAEYEGLLSLLFSPNESTSGNPATTLMLHVFECVTRLNARGHMIKIVHVSSIIDQFIIDHVEFIRKL